MATARIAPEVQLSSQSCEFRLHMGHISRHSLVFFAGTIFAAASGYAFKVYLARTLGAEALGVYTLGMTIIGLLGVFYALGLPQAAVRFVAAYKANARPDLLRGFLVRSATWLLISNLFLVATVLLAGPWIAVRFYHTPALKAYLGLFALIAVVGALNAFLGQTLAGYRDVARRTVITNFVGSPVMMVLAVVLVSWGLGLRGYVAAQVASAVLVLVLLIGAVWKLTPKASGFSAGSLPVLEKQVISFSSAALGMSLLEFVMGQTDKVLIGFYINAREVGIYAVAGALVAFVAIVLQSVNQIFSPTIADLHTRGQIELLGRIFQTLTKWILALTIPLAATMILFAPSLLRMFGHDFEAGWPILVIGTAGQLVNCGTGSVGYLLLMAGQQRRLIMVQAIMSCVMFVVAMLLIPKWGIVGAAIAASLTNVLTNVWCLREVQRSLGLLPFTRSYLRMGVPTLCTLLVLLLWKESLRIFHPAWLVVGMGFLLAYAIFLPVTLACGLDPDDRLIASGVWSRVRGVFQDAEVSP
jgi:O-antigen/teichoic acid export membrane protein